MFKMFLFLYIFGAFLLHNTNCCNITVKLNKYQKIFLMVGLDKLRVFRCGEHRFYDEKQDRYSLLIVLWQIFWILFLILIPLCLRLFNIFMVNTGIEYVCRLYITCVQKIKNIFYVEAIMIAADIMIKLINSGIKNWRQDK